MIDEKAMRAMLENMESAAEEALRADSMFYETLQLLKWEVDRDPRVQSAINNLRAAGTKVLHSFVPHVRIRIRTAEGVVSLSRRAEAGTLCGAGRVAHLTQELRNAASAVILRSRHREELDSIVNEAIGTSDRFEGIATEIESAGYEVVICLDLSAYAQVRQSSSQPLELAPTGASGAVCEPPSRLFSAYDLKFLKALKIKATES